MVCRMVSSSLASTNTKPAGLADNGASLAPAEVGVGFEVYALTDEYMLPTTGPDIKALKTALQLELVALY